MSLESSPPVFTETSAARRSQKLTALGVRSPELRGFLREWRAMQRVGRAGGRAGSRQASGTDSL